MQCTIREQVMYLLLASLAIVPEFSGLLGSSLDDFTSLQCIDVDSQVTLAVNVSKVPDSSYKSPNFTDELRQRSIERTKT